MARSKMISFTEKEIEIIEFTIKTLSEQTFYAKKKNSCNRILEKLNKEPKRIKISSAKAKGRNLQNWTVERIAELLNEKVSKDKDVNNIRGREMGQSGVDVWLHKTLRKKFPIAVECKAQETIKINSFVEQAKNNTSNDLPYWLLVIKNKQIKNPIAVMNWDLFEWLYKYIGMNKSVID